MTIKVEFAEIWKGRLPSHYSYGLYLPNGKLFAGGSHSTLKDLAEWILCNTFKAKLKPEYQLELHGMERSKQYEDCLTNPPTLEDQIREVKPDEWSVETLNSFLTSIKNQNKIKEAFAKV